MKSVTNRFKILAIGLDSSSSEVIEKSLVENGLAYHISYLQNVNELDSVASMPFEAVFFYSNRQSPKTTQDIRKINLYFPRVAITLLCSRVDLQGIVGAFRAGLFDLLTVPVDENEVRTIIYRLQLHDVIQGGMWNPERAVLHLFSKPENFAAIEDIAASLNQYLNLFFKIDKHVFYSSQFEMLNEINSYFKFSPNQQKRIKRFLYDESGLIFGLRFYKNDFHFLIKTGDNKFSYLVAKNTSEFQIHDILSDYLSNVLKTSLSILAESKKSHEIRLLALTDEVTGVFNQRKLLEDLDHHIVRYPHNKESFSLLFIDIDYFKNVNDQFGHIVGSQLLVDLAAVLKGQLRSSDLVYRYGGDEFIVLLPKSNVEESKKIAMRISEVVREKEFTIDRDKKYRLSLSIGIAEFPSDADSAKSIIEFADKMMYMSKKSGRGKVFHITEVVT